MEMWHCWVDAKICTVGIGKVNRIYAISQQRWVSWCCLQQNEILQPFLILGAWITHIGIEKQDTCKTHRYWEHKRHKNIQRFRHFITLVKVAAFKQRISQYYFRISNDDKKFGIWVMNYMGNIKPMFLVPRLLVSSFNLDMQQQQKYTVSFPIHMAIIYNQGNFFPVIWAPNTISCYF